MTTLFNRAVSFSFGRRGFLGRTIEDLRIDFKIKKDSESKANEGTVEIYNLSAETRDLLQSQGLKYELRAGYFGLNEIPLIGVISTGDVVDAVTRRSGPDFITEIKISEGGEALDKSLDKSFAENVSTKTIIGAMVSSLGLAKGVIVGVKDEILKSGYSATGKIKDRLDELFKKQGLEWSIQNGEVQAYPIGKSTNETAVLLDSETGLLKAYREKAKLAGSSERVDRLIFEALINPEIRVGRKVKISSYTEKIDGVFTVRKLTYNGSNRGGNFTVTGEVV